MITHKRTSIISGDEQRGYESQNREFRIMSRSAYTRATRSTPIIPPRRKSLAFLRKKSENHAFEIPQGCNLIVTTAKAVFIWSSTGITKIFHSGSEGIVAARKVSDNGGLLAVADSQVVVLHDIRKGMQKSYRLRGSDGQVRLLQYAGDSKRLFFTTSLQHVVQSYSVKQSKLLNPSHFHPSPPTVVALSCNSHLLLSVSNIPPTIYLTNLTSNAPPILLHPQCSSSTVVAADFHTERASVFSLAFADGTCALYDAAYLFGGGGKGEPRSGLAGTGTGYEISYVKRVHAIESWPSASEPSTNIRSYRGEDKIALVGDQCLSVTSLAFVPGRKAKIVTVGADGKCCVINFAPSHGEARILDSWYIRSLATSLSILPVPSSKVSDLSKAQARTHTQHIIRRDVLVAIGCHDGRVMLFDIRGNLLQESQFDMQGSRVIDVEWTHSNDKNTVQQVKYNYVAQQKPAFTRRKGSIGFAQRTDHPTATDTTYVADSINDQANIPHQEITDERNLRYKGSELPSVFPQAKPNAEPVGVNHQHLTKNGNSTSSEIISIPDRMTPDDETADTYPSENQDTIASRLLSRQLSMTQNLPPSTPAVPIPRTGRNNSVYRLQKENMAQSNTVGLKPSLHHRKVKLRTTKYSKGSNIVSGTPGLANPKIESFPNDEFVDKTPIPRPANEEGWVEFAPENQGSSRKEPLTTLVRDNRAQSHRKSTSFQTSLHPRSEASDDTIIDRSAVSNGPVYTNPLLPPPLSISPRKPESKPKSRSSNNNSQPLPSDETPVQWSTFKLPNFIKHTVGPNQSIPNSLRTSPKTPYPLPPRAVQPLAETTHNPKQPTQAPKTSPAKPPPSPPSLPTTVHEPDPPAQQPSCACQETNARIQAMKDELESQFRAQRIWFEDKLEEMNYGRKALEEENNWLRKELVREKMGD